MLQIFFQINLFNCNKHIKRYFYKKKIHVTLLYCWKFESKPVYYDTHHPSYKS